MDHETYLPPACSYELGMMRESIYKMRTHIIKSKTGQRRYTHLLRRSKDVSRQTNLSLHLLFTVAKIIIGKYGNHYPTFVSKSNLKWCTIVVQLVFALPTHSCCFLFFSCIKYIWQAKILLL